MANSIFQFFDNWLMSPMSLAQADCQALPSSTPPASAFQVLRLQARITVRSSEDWKVTGILKRANLILMYWLKKLKKKMTQDVFSFSFWAQEIFILFIRRKQELSGDVRILATGEEMWCRGGAWEGRPTPSKPGEIQVQLGRKGKRG